jgi:hypothetical protein
MPCVRNSDLTALADSSKSPRMQTQQVQSGSKLRRMARRILRDAIYLCLVMVMSLPVFAQIDRTGLSGTAKDSSGKVLPDVHINIRQEETGLERDTVTSSNGSYYIPELPIGVYTVTFTEKASSR